ncbi:hypothetical protein BDW22DRAFT_1431396 [Trametopsis cervina]|nr:hypothetical protein BDW22DRAFT_1431396 [Trametopsis cervina]
MTINRLPRKIHRRILQYLGDLLEEEPRLSPGAHAIVRKTLAACALTQRTWRRLSQKLLHRVVTVHCGSFKNSLGRYIEAPQEYLPISADISKYPRRLRILSNDIGCESEFSSDEFKAFVQRCGPRITRLSFVANSFSHPIQVLNILGQFRFLEQVSICQHWPVSIPWFTLDTYDLSSIAPPAPSLKAICVRTDHQGLLRMVRDWLMLSPKLTVRDIVQPLRHSLEVRSNTVPFKPLGVSFSRLPATVASPQIRWWVDSETPICPDSTYPTKLPVISLNSIADGHDNELPKNAREIIYDSLRSAAPQEISLPLGFKYF